MSTPGDSPASLSRTTEVEPATDDMLAKNIQGCARELPSPPLSTALPIYAPPSNPRFSFHDSALSTNSFQNNQLLHHTLNLLQSIFLQLGSLTLPLNSITMVPGNPLYSLSTAQPTNLPTYRPTAPLMETTATVAMTAPLTTLLGPPLRTTSHYHTAIDPTAPLTILPNTPLTAATTALQTDILT